MTLPRATLFDVIGACLALLVLIGFGLWLLFQFIPRPRRKHGLSPDWQPNANATSHMQHDRWERDN